MDTTRGQMTAVERVLRWLGIGGIVAAVLLALAETARPLALLLGGVGVGCWVALVVLGAAGRRN